jgi:hypothetical protein
MVERLSFMIDVADLMELLRLDAQLAASLPSIHGAGALLESGNFAK